jgi:hypothetical protein
MAARYIQEYVRRRGHHSIHFSDYPFIRKLYDTEKNIADKNIALRRFYPLDQGGFYITDNSVFDDALSILEDTVVRTLASNATSRGNLAVIEFASTNYSHALRLFSPAFLADSHVLFIDSDLEICIQRLLDRASNHTELDENYISGRKLKDYFSNQSIPIYLKRSDGRVQIVYNMGSLEVFAMKVELIIAEIFQRMILPNSLY